MSGRIRSLKPEILEDAKTAGLSDAAWRLFVSMILMADDHGNLHGEPGRVEAAVFWGSRESREPVASLLDCLATLSLISRYTVRGQRFIHLNGWAKHQKVDKPSRPRVPQPCEADQSSTREGLSTPSRDSPEGLPTSSGMISDLRSPTTDLRPPTTDLLPPTVAVGPDLEPGEPEPGEKTLPMLRRKFGERLVERTGNPPAWTRNTVSDLQALALWLDERGGDASRLADRLLAGFFADDWAASKGFPIAAMAANPGKYLQAPSSGLPGAANGQGEADRERFDENGNYKTMIWGVR